MEITKTKMETFAAHAVCGQFSLRHKGSRWIICRVGKVTNKSFKSFGKTLRTVEVSGDHDFVVGKWNIIVKEIQEAK